MFQQEILIKDYSANQRLQQEILIKNYSAIQMFQQEILKKDCSANPRAEVLSHSIKSSDGFVVNICRAGN